MDSQRCSNITKNLNDSGIFLEFAFLDFTQKYHLFQDVKTQVPFTINSSGMQPIDGTVDFLCLYHSSGNPTIYFIIECKKADPAQKNWIFFQRNESEKGSTAFYRSYERSSSGSFLSPSCVCYPQGNLLFDRSYQVVDSKRTHAFNDQRKDPIYQASMQVNKGLKKLIYDDSCDPNKLCPLSNKIVFFIPVVVTTANLLSWKTDFSLPSLFTGEADVDKMKYEEEEWVEYSAPIPEYLRIGNVDRSSVYIVNSNNLNNFFREVARQMVYAYKRIPPK